MFGEVSDEEHLYMLALNEQFFDIEFSTKVNSYGQMFLEFITKKFGNLSKTEHLDCQIFYYTQQVRKESSFYNRVKVLGLVPKLIQL